ncbi:MAG: glycosyltransferase, partial [Marmoricola sp.]|nr:glycosyltransferase [Marmoricola sp.]
MSPTVSVVVPVHDCLPYLEDALASAFHQTLPREQVEVIAVDDGSTDGSSEALARWAERWPQLRVITQASSGSAARPRNVGLDAARGEYVFFLDGDDCLGPEALERLLDMAARHDSDVVYARLVGAGRQVPAHVFVEDEGRAELTSGIYESLAPFKLFRRA